MAMESSMTSNGPGAMTFAAAKLNEFQWRNLYMKQFGVCTYPPPIPKNPSTTTANYPRRVDLDRLLSDAAHDSAEREASQLQGSANETASQSTLLTMRASRGNSLFSINSESVLGTDHSPAVSRASVQPSRSGVSRGEDDLADLFSNEGDGVPNLFSFLRPRSMRSSGAARGRHRRRVLSETSETDDLSDTTGDAAHAGQTAADEAHKLVNPHRLPRQIFHLHRDAWLLLMDNRVMAWLEREASERGHTAANVRRRLLEAIEGPTPSGRNWAKCDAETFAKARQPPPISEDEAFERVFQSFMPFFSVISPPLVLRRVREEMLMSRRMQSSGLRQDTVDLVGLPVFSQFATWREAFTHRQSWRMTPFSFFLVHDASYNYAQISALYVLMQLIYKHAHTHSAQCLKSVQRPMLLEEARQKLTQAHELRKVAENQRLLCPYYAVQQLTEDLLLIFEQSTCRTTLNMVLHVCGFLTDCVLDPDTAARFLSRDALMRQSSFKVPGMNVADGLSSGLVSTTDEATLPKPRVGSGDEEDEDDEGGEDEDEDDEGHIGEADNDDEEEEQEAATAASLGASSSSASGKTRTRNSTRRTAATTRSTVTDKDNEGGGGKVSNGSATTAKEEHKSDPTASATPTTALSVAHDLAEVFAMKRFTEAEFNALFELSYWFIDAATANARVPVDPSTIPPPKLLVHPEQLSMFTATPRSAVEHSAPQTAAFPHSPSVKDGTGSVASGSSRGRSTAPSPSLQPPSPTAGQADGGAGGPTEHQYIPGKIQLYTPVESLVEVIVIFELRRQALLQQHYVAPSISASVMTTTTSSSSGGGHGVLRESTTSTGSGGTLRPAAANAARSRRRDAGGRNASRPPAATTAGAENYGASRQKQQQELSAKELSLSAATTLLATPLIFVSAYIRLHGAPWLRHLFSHLFNILRRESVLLYVNRLDLDTSSAQPSQAAGVAATPSRQPGLVSPAADPAARPHFNPNVKDFGRRAFFLRMEHLENLICQDIQYVMNEFFSSLHGQRSATRLPQGITALLSQFCITLHTHILTHAVLASGTDLSGLHRGASEEARVAELLYLLKQKRMVGKAFRGEHVSDLSMSRLITNVERYRLAKFILFDAWILPALNNAVTMGYLAENSSLHLRWNIDAFARYLKILVNAPFVERDAAEGVLSGGVRHWNHVTTASQPGTRSIPAAPSSTHRKGPKESPTAPPFTLTLPPYITGIYDVSSGSLVRIYAAPTAQFPPGDSLASASSAASTVPGAAASPELPPLYNNAAWRTNSISGLLSPSNNSNSPGRRPTIEGVATHVPWQQQQQSHYHATLAARGRLSDAGSEMSCSIQAAPSLPAANYAMPTKAVYYKVMDDASWEGLSTSLHNLNEALGLIGYDHEEQLEMTTLRRSSINFDGGSCAMRLLDLFCRSASTRGVSNVVVTEYEVLPSLAAGCVDKIYDLMSGNHPLLEGAIAARVLPGKTRLSPYIACLSGVLLHPLSAATALDNLQGNSPSFADTLMRPVEDSTMLGLLSALVVEQNELPMVDSNALPSLLGTLPAVRQLASGVAGQPGAAHVTSLARRWEDEARKLRQTQMFLTTGVLRPSRQMREIWGGVGPDDALKLLKAGQAAMRATESHHVPVCFEPWWRAMVVALCVKAMTVFTECDTAHADAFVERCRGKVDANVKEHRRLCDTFVHDKGRDTAAATTAPPDGGRRKKQTPFTSSSYRGSNSLSGRLTQQRRRRRRRKVAKETTS